MSCDLQLSVNGGGYVTPQSLGLQLVSRVENNLQMDVLNTVKKCPDFTVDPAFEVNDQIVVLDGEEIVFQGTAGAATFNGGQHAWNQSIRGAFQILEVENFYMPWMVDGWPFSPEPVTTFNLWDQLVISMEQHLNPAWTEIQLGDLPEGMTNILYDTSPVISASYAANMRALLNYHIHAGTWVDYTTDPPTLHVEERGTNTVTVPVAKTMDLTLTNRDDLLPRQAMLRRADAWAFPDVSDPDGQRAYRLGELNITHTEDVYPATDPTVGRGTALTVLRGLDVSWFGAGPMTYVYNAMRVPVWEGGFTMRSADAKALGLRVGASVNISGGREAWSSMLAMVQSVNHNLVTGRCDVQLGLRSTLDSSTLASLFLDWFKLGKWSTNRIVQTML